MSNPIPTLTQLLDIGEEHARLVLIKHKEKDLVPFYHFVVPGNDKDVLMPCRFENVDDKSLAVYMATVIARDLNAVMVMFVSEAWMVAIPAPAGTEATLEGASAAMQDVIPSESPDRVEVVNLVASDGMTTVARHLRMARNKRGKLVALHRDNNDVADSVGGRMIDGILAPVTTH